MWARLSRLGRSATPERPGLRRPMRLANQINLVLGTIYGLVALTDLLIIGVVDNSTLRFGIGVAFCGLSLGLAALHRPHLSRLVLILAGPLLFLVFPAVLHSTREVGLLWMPTGVVTYSILPYLIFSWPSERNALILSQLLLFGFILFSDVLLRSGAPPDLPILDIIDSNYIAFKRATIALWFFLNLPMVYFVRITRRYEDEIIRTHTAVAEQRDQIEVQNQELLAQQEEIKAINQNLEFTVQQRTRELESQNQQLAEYAFINGHHLRGPLARIQGLVNLLEITERVSREDPVHQHLRQSIEEFEEVVSKINHLVEEGSHFSRADFEKSNTRPA